MADPKKRGAKRVAEETNLSSVAVAVTTLEEGVVNIRDVRRTIEDTFNALGTEALPGSIIPTGTKNNSKEAAEYVIADFLEKLAVARKKEAAQAAEKAGVFGESGDYVPGDTVMVFNDPNFSINVKMGKPSKMMGREEVEAAAFKHLGKKSQDFLDECMKDRSATKQIIVSMK